MAIHRLLFPSTQIKEKKNGVFQIEFFFSLQISAGCCVLAKSNTFAKNARQLQFEADVSRIEAKIVENGSEKVLKMLNRPLEGSDNIEAVVEMRNSCSFGHYANDTGKDIDPNVMIWPYDFPFSEKEMRPYIPNVAFGNIGDVETRKFGSLWFRKWSNSGLDAPVLKTLVLVATRALCNEELLLNYRLCNSERRLVDEEED